MTHRCQDESKPKASTPAEPGVEVVPRPLASRGAGHPDPGLMASGGRAAAPEEEEEDVGPDSGCLAWPSSPPTAAALSGSIQAFPQ